MITVFIGYDKREDEAYRVCANSIRRHASKPVNIVPLKIEKLRAQGLMTREVVKKNGQMFDVVSNAPQATEFATSRFLSLLLEQDGWAVFVDCDVIFMGDIYELFKVIDSRKPLFCVKHEHKPAEAIKMDGQAQVAYPRKNWSSFFAFNAGHNSNKKLTLEMINTLPGRDLHRFCWLADDEIGELGPEWNWLVNVQPKPARPIVAHFTLGGPWFENWPGADYDDYWLEEQFKWHNKR